MAEVQHLLSEGDFRGDINVSGTEQTAVKEELCRFIAKHEPRFFRGVLGYPLYKVLMAGAAATTHDQRWEDLWNGAEWIYNGETVYFDGLRTAAASYVYFFFARNLASVTTTAGERIASLDNSTPAEAREKAACAWSEMSRIVDDLWCFLRNNKVSDVLVYTEFDEGGIICKNFRPINPWF